jgi:hypothetical protein
MRILNLLKRLIFLVWIAQPVGELALAAPLFPSPTDKNYADSYDAFHDRARPTLLLFQDSLRDRAYLGPELIGQQQIQRHRAHRPHGSRQAPSEPTAVATPVPNMNPVPAQTEPQPNSVPEPPATPGPSYETTLSLIVLFLGLIAGWIIYLFSPRRVDRATPNTTDTDNLPHKPATPSFEISEQNTIPFNNMMTSLLEGKTESFCYWRDRLYSTGICDAQEYTTRLLHAVYAVGVLRENLYGDISLIDGYFGLLANYPDKAFPTAKVALNNCRKMLAATIENCRLAIQSFADYDLHPMIVFLLDDAASEKLDAAFDSLMSYREQISEISTVDVDSKDVDAAVVAEICHS